MANYDNIGERNNFDYGSFSISKYQRSYSLVKCDNISMDLFSCRYCGMSFHISERAEHDERHKFVLRCEQTHGSSILEHVRDNTIKDKLRGTLISKLSSGCFDYDCFIKLTKDYWVKALGYKIIEPPHTWREHGRMLIWDRSLRVYTCSSDIVSNNIFDIIENILDGKEIPNCIDKGTFSFTDFYKSKYSY